MIFREEESPVVFMFLLFRDMLNKFMELFHLVYLYLCFYFDIFETRLDQLKFLFEDCPNFLFVSEFYFEKPLEDKSRHRPGKKQRMKKSRTFGQEIKKQ